MSKLTQKEIDSFKQSLMEAADRYDDYPFEIEDCGCQMNFIPMRTCIWCGDYYEDEKWSVIMEWCKDNDMPYCDNKEDVEKDKEKYGFKF